MKFNDVVYVIESEPLFPRSVFEDMGLFRGLLHTIWMIFHPYMNARLSAAGFRNSILRKLNKF